ncbi:hypothetical protein GACE_2108 [Geoglobus acetivorans]|uniref:SpoVT-AbrB domain-containing protein n=2 Tax=Geoglobus acetivorans TaxID=565033 RepID=A0A0A7GGC7_GEOAI|nr:hypothetical protein GACE_2108 [Geoglobus acetivorans]
MEAVIKRFASGTPYITFPKKIFDEFFSKDEETPVEVSFENGKIVIERIREQSKELPAEVTA